MALFKIDENPDAWGRCTRDGKVVRWSNEEEVQKHLGHKVASLDGFHVNELIRYWLGLL